MVAARGEFLCGHHFRLLAESIAELCVKHASSARIVMEAAAGTGYYISHVLDALPLTRGLALDLSKSAARSAARAHVRLDSVVTDILEELPIKTESVDIALNVFRDIENLIDSTSTTDDWTSPGQ